MTKEDKVAQLVRQAVEKLQRALALAKGTEGTIEGDVQFCFNEVADSFVHIRRAAQTKRDRLDAAREADDNMKLRADVEGW